MGKVCGKEALKQVENFLMGSLEKLLTTMSFLLNRVINASGNKKPFVLYLFPTFALLPHPLLLR